MDYLSSKSFSSSLRRRSPIWLARDSSERQNIRVKPSSSFGGLIKLRFPLIMKLPVLINIPVGGVLETWCAYTQQTLDRTLCSQHLLKHNSNVAASLSDNWETALPLGFLRIHTAAPCNSECMKRSPLSMYLFTKASFYCAFLPPMTRQFSLVINQMYFSNQKILRQTFENCCYLNLAKSRAAAASACLIAMSAASLVLISFWNDFFLISKYFLMFSYAEMFKSMSTRITGSKFDKYLSSISMLCELMSSSSKASSMRLTVFLSKSMRQIRFANGFPVFLSSLTIRSMSRQLIPELIITDKMSIIAWA